MWAGPPQWTQWALNPSAYQDMSNDQVDWARLAQQWIMMKETVPPSQQPPASTPPEKPALQVEEGGEAPMDIGKDDDEPHASPENWNYAGWQGQTQWNPGSSGYSSTWPAGAPHAVIPAVTKNGSNALGYNYSSGGSGFDFNSRPDSFNQAAGFWPDGTLMPPGTQQMPFLRGSGGQRGQRWETNKLRDDLASEEEEEAEPVIDAAKRRTLPIWIREGLEKMEREKQKKIERERAEVERVAAMQARRLEEAAALNEIRQERGLPPRSKFESDSDDKSDEEAAPPVPSPPRISSPEPPKRKSRFHDGPPPVVRKKSPIRLTKEELMLKVRRTMTEVLLDITTSEILALVKESLAKARRKAPADAASNNNHMPISSLTANLGLGMYGSDEESSSDGSDNDDRAGHSGRHSGEDSDTNLKEEIRRRKAEFVNREREIQDAAAAADRDDEVAGGEAQVAEQHQGVESQVEQRATTPDAAKPENGAGKEEKVKRAKSSSSRSSEDSSSTSSKRKHKRKKRKRDRKRRSTSRDRKNRRDRSGSRDKRERSTSRERRRRDRSDSRSRRRDRSTSRENKSRRRSESRDKKSTRHRSESVESKRKDAKSRRRSSSRDDRKRRDSRERKRRSESREKRRHKSRSPSTERRRRSRSNDRSRHSRRARRSHSSESDYSRRRRNRNKHRSSSSSASDKKHRKRR